MKFNLNHHVKVKITEHGLECMRKKHEEICAVLPDWNIDFRPPDVDEEGYTRMQLWCVMETFGQHMGNGKKLPIETFIVLENKDT